MQSMITTSTRAKKWYTVNDAALILDQSPRWVRHLLAEGKIRGFKIRQGKGKLSTKIARSDLIQYLSTINPDRTKKEIESILT